MGPNKTSTNIPIYIRLILSFNQLGKSDLTHHANTIVTNCWVTNGMRMS